MMRISKKEPMKWFLNNFGFAVGGVKNYDAEQIRDILTGLRLIIENSGYMEIEWLGRFLVKLSDNPKVLDRFLEELKEFGY
jgi:hypothetical protein